MTTAATTEPPAAAGALTMTCARLREWVREAQPGARLHCGAGVSWSMAAGLPVAQLVGELQAKGFLTAHCQRDPETQRLVHLVQRSPRPLLKGESL